MAHDPILESRIENALFRAGATPEKKPMFGGVAFMVDGHMACALSPTDLHVRIGPIAYEAALEENRARPMNVTGKVMRGWVTLMAPDAMEEDELKSWVSRALMHVRTLEPKGGEEADAPETIDNPDGLAIVRVKKEPGAEG
jgi:hypothetical protein